MARVQRGARLGRVALEQRDAGAEGEGLLRVGTGFLRA